MSPRAPAARRGFTLTEMLVVIAITSVLMLMLFVPLSRSLELSQRGQADMRAQDEVRRAVRRVTQELANAVQVLPPRDLQLWGYNLWTEFRNRPRPQPGAVPEPYLSREAIIVFRLPRVRYFCTLGDHNLTQDDLDNVIGAGPGTPHDLIGLGDCPRHPGSPVELRPFYPVRPDPRLVAYFIGLEDPGLGDPDPAVDNAPYGVHYENQPLFLGGAAVLAGVAKPDFNAYNLYRVEFDPTDPRYNNYANPDFFYDDTPITFAGQTLPRYRWWREKAQRMMSGPTADVVRWVRSGGGGKFVPQSLVRFTPAPVAQETAQPNRALGQYATAEASALPGDVAPTDYQTDYGNWLDVPGLSPADGTEVVPVGVVIGSSGGVEGPRIQVFENGVTPVFDSVDTSLRRRLVAYDSLTGRIVFSITRRDSGAGLTALERDYYDAPIDSATLTVSLAGDTVQDGNFEPRGWGSAASSYPTTTLTPGSVEVQVVTPAAGPGGTPLVERLRMAGWEGLPNPLLDRPVFQGDLAPDEFAVNYRTGVLTLPDTDPSRWVGVGPGLGRRLLVKYSFQTNLPRDVVRVSYVTREQFLVNCGIVQYTRSRREALPFQVAERVVIRNNRR
jgi:prepilin-type N-terminal cleavage/methylation domain-containing protein